MLYLVATPIGNIKDISYRAIETLKESDLVLAEDTRRSGQLLNHYNIKKKIISYNDFNKEKKTKDILISLKKGYIISLVSDSGTPGISDPGFYLVRECIKHDIKVSPIPGANSVISALVCSGLATDRFIFYGFLPKKKSQKTNIFQKIKQKKETCIFFESPHRIKKTISILSETLPEKKIIIARELTKKFEEFIRGSPEEIDKILEKRKIKGEIVLLIGRKV
ncbi:16S rRNA (cytidine(1402)-2'-O)-methyltransferase [Candidatus Woesearchaeota archaeon]|nr:16S rRNA (cytidine(1402)-2'-O)-methyltransferase [Candidatus Woesearchaeota archaeon]